jgi:RimJ/RimL family protein N-acetyltransferase
MIFLKKPELSDAPLIQSWENDVRFREELFYDGPYTLEDIEELIVQLSKPESNQQRFLICTDEKAIGAVDLCEIASREAFVSILIADFEERQKGYASEALRLVEKEAEVVGIRRLKALVRKNNKPSIELFNKLNYVTSSENSIQKIDGVDYIHVFLLIKWLEK